ncbi:aspartate/glutamate racemase family protein [Nonomuraea sp. NPDC049400]|uniref:aspartate/glutamate racemase family protein n=1 Tax=Nonomuraea sp. NPDC049400 TaxID=3364352 RepID=UPI00378D1DE6
MLLWYQKHVVVGDADQTHPDHLALLDKLYAEHAAKAIASLDTTEKISVEIHGLPPGTYDGMLPEHLVGYGQFGLRFGHYFAKTAIMAEEAGFDAWISGAGQDPGLAAARVDASIPVVGYGEATWHLARREGHRLGLLGFGPLKEPITANIAAAGADLADYQVIEKGPELVQRALAKEDFDPLMEAYAEAAKAAAKAGAQWLVPAEGISNVIFAHLGVEELGGLHVVDPGGVAIHTAVQLCQMRAAGIIARPTTGYWRKRAPRELVQRVDHTLDSAIGARRR